MNNKILFIIPEYSHGGTNKSLENLLTLIDKSRYDIHIYCIYEDGPDYYKKIFEPYVLRKSRLYYWLHDNVATRKFMGLLNKLTKRDNFASIYKREAKWLQSRHHFDVVIAYQEGVATVFASYFQSGKKIAWYHCPYVNFKKKDLPFFTDLYSQFNAIPCVSEEFVRMFQENIPPVKDRVCCIYNTLDSDSIRKQAEKKESDENFKTNSFTMVSVGRFVRQKQFEKIPSIAHSILQQGTCKPFRWYIIASGELCRQKTMEAIEKFALKDYVILLGEKSNPYYYMKNSDLVVCTSDSESFSYVIAEGKIVHTPVVSNNFPVAYEVLDKSCGWIASIEEMPQLIYRLVNDIGGEYSKIRESIKSYEYDNDAILEKVYKIIDE
jgi:glycosyltransferase involved in cell wall biosynthesis